MHVWICYPMVLWVLYEAWTTSDRGESPHRPHHYLQLHPGHAQLLPCSFGGERACTMYLISGVVVQWRWHRYGYAIPLLYECYIKHGPHMAGVNHPTGHRLPSTTPQISSAVTLVLGTKSLNHEPQKWHSDPSMMINIWICYPTVLWVLYDAWTTSDRGESPHRPQHDLQLHPGHAQILPSLLKQISLNNMPQQCYSVQRMMIHVWICYLTVLWVLYEEWTTSDRGESPLRPCHDLQLYPRHAQMLPWLLNPRAWTMNLSSGIVVQGRWYIYEYPIPQFYECYTRHGPCLEGGNHPTDHIMTSNYTQDMLRCYPVFW